MEVFGVGLGALLVVGLLALLLWYSQVQSKKIDAAWQAVAAEVGGSFTPAAWNRPRAVDAVIDGVPVRLDTYTVSTGKSSSTYTRVAAVTPRPIAGLELGKEGVGSMIGKVVRGDDLQIGDVAFDHRVVVRTTDEAALRGALHASARQDLMVALADKHTVQGGQVKWVQGGILADPTRLVTELRRTARLASHITTPPDRAQALADVVTQDNDVDVRRATVRFLERERPRDLTRLAPELIRDSDPHVRVAAADYAGDAGVQVARQLALRRGDAAVRARAVRIAGAALDDDELRKLIDEGGAVGVAALKTVATTARDGVDDAVLAALRGAADVQVAAARAVIARKLGAAEPALLDALRGDDKAVRIAVAGALAAVGSVAAVQHLLPLTQGLLADTTVKSAARAAVTAIQGRATGSRGGLAVANGAGGELAVSRGAGDLSAEGALEREAAGEARAARRRDAAGS